MSREHLNGFGAAIGPIDAMEHDIEGEDGENFGSEIFENRPSVASTHANLARMVTARELFMKALATKHVTLESENGRWRFNISPGVEHDIIPWWMGTGTREKLWLWGEAGKMDCPTWDVPAGAPAVGGTCPGATAGQSVVPEETRRSAEKGAQTVPGTPVGGSGQGRPGTKLKVHLDENRSDAAEGNGGTICQYCYAMGGQYWNQGVQPKEILTFWWSQKASRDGSFAPIVAESLLNDPRLKEHTVKGVKHRPVRIHSSGDFFDKVYAAAWVETCNLVGDEEARLGLTPSLFWAPTRTWAAWPKDIWPTLLAKLKRPNLVVRASAYNLDDFAPGALTPGGAMGSTSVWKAHQKKNDERYDYNCPIYEYMGKGRTCTKVGCRACWVLPEKRINYTTHF